MGLSSNTVRPLNAVDIPHITGDMLYTAALVCCTPDILIAVSLTLSPSVFFKRINIHMVLLTIDGLIWAGDL